MPDLKPLSALRVWPDNYNRNDVRKIARSILLYGFNGALRVWQDDMVIAGNHTLEALRLLRTLGREAAIKELDLPADRDYPWPPANVEAQGEAWRVPWVNTAHLSWEEAKAFAIADNHLARQATPVPELLAQYLTELMETDEVLFQATGYDEGELRQLLAELGTSEGSAEDPGAEVDRADELRAQWGTEEGQLWEVPSQSVPGRSHRLLCGDCTDPHVVKRLLNSHKPLLMVTDPPYGVQVDHSWRDGIANHAPTKRGGQLINDDRADWSEVYPLFDVPVLYVWHGGLHTAEVQAGLERVGYAVRQQIVWVKSVMVLSRSNYHWRHEPCWYAVKKGETAQWVGDRKQTTVWELNSPISPQQQHKADADTTVHPTQKPVEVYAIPIRNHTVPGEVVVDPFAGSGTLFVGCEQLGRVGYGLELDPRFVAVTLERLAGLGLEPRLAG